MPHETESSNHTKTSMKNHEWPETLYGTLNGVVNPLYFITNNIPKTPASYAVYLPQLHKKPVRVHYDGDHYSCNTQLHLTRENAEKEIIRQACRMLKDKLLLFKCSVANDDVVNFVTIFARNETEAMEHLLAEYPEEEDYDFHEILAPMEICPSTSNTISNIR
jgi:hypothetical protein